jgi:hypothetical protein
MPNSARAPLVLTGASAETRARAARHDELIRFLARLDSVTVADSPPAGAVPFVIGEATASLSVAGLIDVAAEVARLKKDMSPPTTRTSPRPAASSTTPTSSPAPLRRLSRKTANASPPPKPPAPSCKAALDRLEGAPAD